jgi:hypothetical protein
MARQRIRPFIIPVVFVAFGLVACTAEVADLGGRGGDESSESGASSADAGRGDGACASTESCTDAGTAGDSGSAADADAGSCALKQYTWMVPPGGALSPRPAGSVLRLTLVYQGSRLAITDARGVTKILSPGDGPFTPGATAGYWVELRSATGATLFTRLLQDPTVMEAVTSEGGFVNLLVPFCDEKLIPVDVPNDSSGKAIVVFGSPYGTYNAASEIARFVLP